MHHSKTPQDNKDNALCHNGSIHLEIATSAPGIEVKIPNIKRDVTFQEPENMESYFQEVGMAGRDGSDVLSMFSMHTIHVSVRDSTMRAFVKNKVKCKQVETLSP